MRKMYDKGRDIMTVGWATPKFSRQKTSGDMGEMMSKEGGMRRSLFTKSVKDENKRGRDDANLRNKMNCDLFDASRLKCRLDLETSIYSFTLSFRVSPVPYYILSIHYFLIDSSSAARSLSLVVVLMLI